MVLTMSFESIVGIIATAVFGMWAILLAKKREYPGKLTYFREKPIRLFDDVVRNLPQVTVNYNGQPVQKNITLMKGFLINTGSKDITTEMVERPLSLELAEGYIWREASAKSSSDSEERAKIINARRVDFSLGLFRCNEYFRFEGLIEVQEGKTWQGRLRFAHRIVDTSDVHDEKLPEKTNKPWGTILFCLGIIGMFLLNLITQKAPSTNDFVGGLVWISMCLLIMICATAEYRTRKRIRSILKLDS